MSRVPPLKLLKVAKSPIARYKLRATWSDGTHTDFGATGYSDYSLHKDKERRERYRMRHRKDRITIPQTAGALSWHLLWGASTDISKNVTSFKRSFSV